MTLAETIRDWLGTFWRILILPKPKTFADEAEKASNKFGSAMGWAVFIAIYSYSVPVLAGYVFDLRILISAIIIFPLIVVLIPSATHFVVQRVFHRKEYLYDKFLYIFTAILVLFQLIINPITFFVPHQIAVVANDFVIGYQVLLFIIALKAMAKLNYWQTFVTVVITFLVGGIIFICAIPFIASIMGGVNGTFR